MPKAKIYRRIDAKKDLPKRSSRDNKTRGGKCLVIAGSKGMKGAAVLAATAAARAGAGYVYIASEQGALSPFESPDFLEYPFWPAQDVSSFMAIALGPGLQNEKKLKAWILKLAKLRFNHVVLDASALNVLAKIDPPLQLPPTWILTPHEGELSRLLQVSSSKIRLEREAYVQRAQEKWGCIVLLKGHGTFITDGKTLLKNSTGNSSLAKAGTGDVLTGIILGLLSQKVPALQAAALGAYIHGKMADQWIKTGHDVLSLLASDLLQMLPTALHSLRRSP